MLIPAATQCEGGRTWYQLLEPYLGGPTDGSEDLYSPARPAWQTCPAKKFPADQKMWLSVGYGWNQVYFGSSGSGEPDITYNPSYRRLSEVTQPSKTIIIADNMDHFVSGSEWQYALLYGPYGSGGMLAKRHQGGGNYLFMDGHVEWMSPTNATREVEGKDWYLFRRNKLVSHP
jgi:prepilin-type processing-associated H-X9-DG protein